MKLCVRRYRVHQHDRGNKGHRGGFDMKRNLIILAALLMPFIFSSPASAVCPCTVDDSCLDTDIWSAQWTDIYGQTTYRLEAPCKVFIGIPFDINATVTDAAYTNDDVASSWAIRDEGSVIAGGGFNWLSTSSGQWQRTVTQTYTGIPINHLIEFTFSDLGQGSGAHFWAARLLGETTVDPYPVSVNTPPTADAGPNIHLAGQDQNNIILQGNAVDQDGDALTYRWLEGTTELLPSTPVAGSGSAALSLASIPRLSLGTHLLTLEVSDGTTAATDTMELSVENSAPVSAPSGGGIFQVGENILLHGSAADFDGDVISCRWLKGATVLAEGVIPTMLGGNPVQLPEHVITGGLPLGPHSLTLEVSDGIHIVSADILVTVVDTIAPTLAPSASTTIIWPPKGKMKLVTISANAHDNSGLPVTLQVQVTSNQLPLIKKRKIIPDYDIVKIDRSAGVIVLQLRTAGPGDKDGVVYTVIVTATDRAGNAASAEVLIRAPHDQGRR